ncbi:MAG TPA: MipA/OmpV family protein [Syntrophorhabdaceae bacterium]
MATPTYVVGISGRIPEMNKFHWRYSMKYVAKIVLLSLFAILALTPGVLRAQQAAFEVDNAPTIVGILVGAAPDYLGSKNYKGVAAPFLKYTLPGSNQYLLLRGTELSLNIVDHPVFRLGPVLNYRPERSNVENDQVDRMTKIDSAIEGGAYLGFEFIDPGNPRCRLLTTLTWTADMSGAYNGWLVTGLVRGWWAMAKNWDVGLGISSTYGDSAYTSRYFGVDVTDAFLSGLPRHNASAGFRDVSATPAIVYHLNQNWHIAGGVRYMRLLGDAANSPVVDNVGSKDQWVMGAGVLYSWR